MRVPSNEFTEHYKVARQRHGMGAAEINKVLAGLPPAVKLEVMRSRFPVAPTSLLGSRR
jgi:hypothetical protein